MTKLLTLFSFVLIIGMSSCKKDDTNNNPTPQPALAASNMLNISYGNDPLQKMDVYLPAGRTTASTKTIIMIHGGAWSSGDKNDFAAYVDSLQRRLPDYAVININYRLSTGTANLFPAQENDVKAAVDFIYGKRGEYVVSDKLVLLGASAGAHLALLQAYKYSTPKIKAVVDLFGPADMTAMYNDPAPFAPATSLALVVGATPLTNSTIYTTSSPMTYVSTTSAPTIILHGGVDPLVKVTQSTNLGDKLTLNGVTNQYVFYPTEAHGWVGVNLYDSFNKIESFIRLYAQ